MALVDINQIFEGHKNHPMGGWKVLQEIDTQMGNYDGVSFERWFSSRFMQTAPMKAIFENDMKLWEDCIDRLALDNSQKDSVE